MKTYKHEYSNQPEIHIGCHSRSVLLFAYAQKHPHIILIMTDQQRADAIGCMGNDAVISPNLDALAAEEHYL